MKSFKELLESKQENLNEKDEKIKIGSKVKVLDSPANRKHKQDFYIGDIGTVETIDSKGYIVGFHQFRTDNIGGYSYPTLAVLKKDVKLIK